MSSLKNKLNPAIVIPCGLSDQRNIEYENSFSIENYYSFLVNSRSPLIIDIGAHKGESILFFKSIFPSAQIISFEPEPNNFNCLEAVAKEKGAQAFNYAIGDADEHAVFFQQQVSHLGGLLPINTKSIDSLGFAATALNQKINVKKLKLDSFCIENSINHIDILKIDVQGFESKVLQGATSALRFTSCVSVEISLFDFYASDSYPLLMIEQYMKNAGMHLWDISKISKNPKNFRTDWIEVMYKKVNS